MESIVEGLELFDDSAAKTKQKQFQFSSLRMKRLDCFACSLLWRPFAEYEKLVFQWSKGGWASQSIKSTLSFFEMKVDWWDWAREPRLVWFASFLSGLGAAPAATLRERERTQTNKQAHFKESEANQSLLEWPLMELLDEKKAIQLKGMERVGLAERGTKAAHCRGKLPSTQSSFHSMKQSLIERKKRVDGLVCFLFRKLNLWNLWVMGASAPLPRANSIPQSFSSCSISSLLPCCSWIEKRRLAAEVS